MAKNTLKELKKPIKTSKAVRLVKCPKLTRKAFNELLAKPQKWTEAHIAEIIWQSAHFDLGCIEPKDVDHIIKTELFGDLALNYRWLRKLSERALQLPKLKPEIGDAVPEVWQQGIRFLDCVDNKEDMTILWWLSCGCTQENVANMLKIDRRTVVNRRNDALVQIWRAIDKKIVKPEILPPVLINMADYV